MKLVLDTNSIMKSSFTYSTLVCNEQRTSLTSLLIHFTIKFNVHLLNHKKGTRLFFEEARINGFAVKLLSSNFLKTVYGKLF